jgi:hypothetical protein
MYLSRQKTFFRTLLDERHEYPGYLVVCQRKHPNSSTNECNDWKFYGTHLRWFGSKLASAQIEFYRKENDMKVKILEILERVLTITAFVMVANVASSYGQGITAGNMEVAGHLGIVSGIGSHASFGGSLGVPVNNRFILFGDLSYIPMGGGSVTSSGATASAGARAFNFNGTLQYQFKQTNAVVPYAGAGLGLLHSSFDSSTNIPGSPPISVSGSSTDLYFNIGGGLRYFVNQRWGFRPELMIFAGPSTYVRLAGGIFYRFGE